MQRTGKVSGNSHGLVDDLSLSYNGNQLIAVDDEANGTALNGSFEFAEGGQDQDTEYWYDAAGSLGADVNKGISTIWNNIVALPSLVQFSNRHRKDYQYDANGIKRRVIQTTATTNVTVPMGQSIALTDAQVLQRDTTDYCGNVIYENGMLKMLLTEEGYVTMNGTTPTYHYYLKDHQGNNRVVIDQNENVEQRNHYYPFGGLFSGETVAGINPFKYNGKELDRMHGLDLYDYGARQMDPALGVFTSFDPLAEKYPDVSPYAYCLNNPIRFIDPDGEDVWEINDQGEIINRIEDETQDAFYIVAKDQDGNYQRTYTTDSEGNKTYDSVSFEYGTVESQKNVSIEDGTIDIYRVRGDDNGTQLFEFLSKNTNVEWSQAQTGVAGEDGLDFLTTSHQEDRERGMSRLFSKQLRWGYNIRDLSHSHPNNTPFPSSVDGGKKGDVGFAEGITRYLLNRNRNVPTFRIFIPAVGSYINY
jgi:RHS repeat-associated protein